MKSSDPAATERLRAGKELTVVVASGGSALVERFQDGVVAALDQRNLSSGETYIFGEYTIDVVLRITCLTGELTYTEGQDTGLVTDALNEGAGGGMGVGSVPAAVRSYVSVREFGNETRRKTVLTITDLPLTVPNATAGLQGIGAKIYDFPEGRINIDAACASIAEKTASVILDTLNGGATCKFGVGTTVGVNATLATTEQDIVPVTSITSSTVINVAGAAARAVLAAGAAFDGATAAKAAFLNFSVPTDGDLDADASVKLSGTVVIVWTPLADI